jgi:hypothetical protein
MLYATFAKAPTFAAKVAKVDLAPAKAVQGRAQRLRRRGRDQPARPHARRRRGRRHLVAARKGRNALEVTWAEHPTSARARRLRRQGRRTGQGPAASHAEGRRRRRRGPEGRGQGGDGDPTPIPSSPTPTSNRRTARPASRTARSRSGLRPRTPRAAASWSPPPWGLPSRHHHPHDPHRRRLRPAADERLHGRGAVDLENGRRAGQAAVDPRGRHPPRLLPSGRLAPFQRRVWTPRATSSPGAITSSASARANSSPWRPA